MIVLDQFFLQNMFLVGMTWVRTFSGSFRSFLGPWEGLFFRALDGISDLGGGFTFYNSRVVLDVQRLIISTDT